jgi:hypothetical protein
MQIASNKLIHDNLDKMPRASKHHREPDYARNHPCLVSTRTPTM